MLAYFLVTVAIGWLVRWQSSTSRSFLDASRSLPLPVVAAAYLAANCGALEIVGLSAMAAQYGVQAFHFYWIGAIPAMIFLALWMMPVYRASGVRSVPEYLELRFGQTLRLVNTLLLAATVLMLAGISLYAMAQVLEAILGLRFFVSILLCSTVVLASILLGGLRATIYNEVFQLLVMIAGLLPLAIRAARTSTPASLLPHDPHLWTRLPLFSQGAPLDLAGVVFGLGFVLSFGYWCTDFVLMQRAFTARAERDARQVPLWAGFGKLVFSFIVVVPGLAAYRILPPAAVARQHFDQTLPALMNVLYGPAMRGLGLTALAASLMSGLSANVSAFAALFTEDLYRVRLRPGRPDRHYLRVARLSSLAAVGIAAGASYVDFFFGNLMEHVQLIFSIVGAPFWAVFLLGMLSQRTDQRGALIGLVTGMLVALGHAASVTLGLLRYGSLMNASFHGAIYAFVSTLGIGWLASSPGRVQPETGGLLVFRWRSPLQQPGTGLLLVLSGVLLLACLLLNAAWR